MRESVEPVTVGILIYRSPRWLDFVLRGLGEAKNATPILPFVLANDPTDEIAADPRVSTVFRNPDPDEYYISRVYRAWNHLVTTAKTEFVVLLNSDMYVSDGWLDALMAHCDKLPTSLLVESGRIHSAMPEYVCNLGTTPASFDYEAWRTGTPNLRAGIVETTSPGRLYMPVLVRRDEFLDAGGYPEGNINGVSGDKMFFDRFTRLTGRAHVTVHDSIVYHAQEGEMRDA